MGEENKKEEGKFRVTDRRTFTSEGDLRTDTGRDVQSDREGSSKASTPSEEAQHPESSPAIDFSSFLLSLATTAMVHLGEFPDPATRQPNEDLTAAGQMIDILGILEKKTEGNLTSEESRLLSEILYELRMKYMTRKKVIEL